MANANLLSCEFPCTHLIQKLNKLVCEVPGIPTADKHPGEMFVEATKVWVTDPAAHPHHIEFLRFEQDSPVHGPVRDLPHVAFRVERLEAELSGAKILLGPFNATDTLRVVFVLEHGAVFEFMESSVPGHWFRR